MRWACCAVIGLSACYSPNLLGGAPCDLTSNSCPTGQTCVASAGGGGVCMSDRGRTPDAGSDASMGGDAGGTCAGQLVTSKLLGNVCLSAAPTAPISLAATIDTGRVAATTGCTQILPQTGGPSLCIIAGTTIDIPASATARVVGLVPAGSTATATNALVLIATQSITIGGTLDVSSHLGETVGGTPSFGAGARTPAGCLVAGVDGQAGNGSSGGGGGAGGSFGGAGAAGGTGGGGNGNVAHGNPAAAAPPTMLVGGCPGGKGGDGAGAPVGGDNTGGSGGSGGGAVLLLAGTSINIAGKVNASGSGGGGGGPGNNSSGGGGGGGAGGMIGLEATTIAVTGLLLADGGGGGGGGGNQGINDAGKNGSDPTPAVPLTAAAGGTATNNGGAGGNGSVGATAPVAGKNSSGTDTHSAGGGGGGGAGAIRVYGVPASAIGGTVSPPAS